MSNNSDYQIKVKVHNKWVAHFQKTKVNLCTSFGMNSNYSKVTYDIIATAEDPTPMNTISWSEEYAIAGCKDGCEFGGPVYASTSPILIALRHSFTVRRDWTFDSPDPNALAPKNGWLFINEISASALLHKKIKGVQHPIYTTSIGGTTPPPGQHTLTPNGNVIVFFTAQDAGTAFNLDVINTKFYEHSYISQQKVTLEFNEEGEWQVLDGQGNAASKPEVPSKL